MKNYLVNGNGHRLAGAGAGFVIANLVLSILVDQWGLALHPNVVANGTLCLAMLINYLVSKHKRGGK
jgi:uncharacterized membrane protein YfcA